MKNGKYEGEVNNPEKYRKTAKIKEKVRVWVRRCAIFGDGGKGWFQRRLNDG
jgi:hypothetical protein